MNPVNPTMPPDQFMNPLVPTMDQMSFIYTHYPEYAQSPTDMIVWLYQMACFNEEQARMLNAQYAENAYSKKPNRGGRKVNTKNRGDDDSEEEEEDVVYFNKQVAKKPTKPQVVQKKELTAEEIERKKLKEKKDAEK